MYYITKFLTSSLKNDWVKAILVIFGLVWFHLVWFYMVYRYCNCDLGPWGEFCLFQGWVGVYLVATRYLLKICSWINLFISIEVMVLVVSLIWRDWDFLLCVVKMSPWFVYRLVCSLYLQLYSLGNCQVDVLSCTWGWQGSVSAGVILSQLVWFSQ